MNKIGILGGTFNPIHTVHLQMAGAACNQYDLDEVWFMPSNHPPHKEESDIVSNEHRQRMIQFAISCCKKFRFSDFEYSRPGTTYTSDTLSLLHESYPDTQFYFIMGADSLFDFEDWREPGIISQECILLAAARDHCRLEEIQQQIRMLKEKYDADIRILNTPDMEIASADIRGRIAG